MWANAATGVALAAETGKPILHQPPSLDVLMLFGFVVAVATLVCFLHRRQARSWRLALSICLMGMSAYAFLAGAWPVGITEAVWSVMAFQKWRQSGRIPERKTGPRRRVVEPSRVLMDSESRITRMFGPR